MTPRSLLLVFIVLAAWSSGCKPVERDRCAVSGTAHFQGKPLTGYHIALYSEALGGGGAEIGPDGAFRLSGPMQDGEYLVAFVVPADTKPAQRAQIEALNLPRRYLKNETTDLRVTIVPGQNALTLDVKP